MSIQFLLIEKYKNNDLKRHTLFKYALTKVTYHRWMEPQDWLHVPHEVGLHINDF